MTNFATFSCILFLKLIIIIKLYLYTDKSGTAAPFTGVYTHYDKKKYIDHKSSKRKNIL